MTSAQEFNCIFCNISFDDKEELQIHFRKHGDPKFNQTVKNSKNEMASEKSEDGEVVNCDVCSDVFPTISKAITHKHKMHPDHDAKYFCPWCGKLFTMKHLYNKHIQSNHKSEDQEQAGFHCDYCEVDFFMPSAMVYHNKYFHRQDTELAAIGHSKKLKMFNQEMLQVYYCPFCGEEYCNKVNLHKHMSDDHGDENQSPEDILRCPLCDAVFYHLDAYELHLTFHSIDDLYSEDNELAKEITEFSLETVPPTMEKVENESQEEDAGGSFGIEELLQQAMNESNDNDNTNEEVIREKRKKHKKHKKSKKAAITLDEFLTMNKDVFGEGIDFQGIEEVPSQIVAKQLNRNTKQKPGPKPLPSELQKLRKQGIVVKKNPVKHPSHLQGMKVTNKKIIMNYPQNMNKSTPTVQTKSNVPNTSNELLTKLLNQNNSQIKIVRKPAQTKLNNEELATEKDSSDSKISEADEQKQVETSNSKESAADSNKITGDESKAAENGNEIKESVGNIVSDYNSDEQKSKEDVQKSNLNDYKESIQEHVNEKDSFDDSNLKERANLGESEKRNSNSALRNISQNITIKSVLESCDSIPTDSKQLQVKHVQDSEKPLNDSDLEDEIAINKGNVNTNAAHIKNDSKNTSLNALKHLSHLITVKPMSPSKNLTPAFQDTTEQATDFDEDGHDEYFNDESDVAEQEINEDIIKKSRNPSVEKELKSENQNTYSKLDALKSLSKHITIKSVPLSPNKNAGTSQISGNVNKDNNFEEDIESEDVKNKIKQNSSVNMKKLANFKSPETNNSSPNLTNKAQVCNPVQKNKEVNMSNGNTSKTLLSETILKQLPNITAKPVNVGINTKQQIMTPTESKSVDLQKDKIVQNSVRQKKKEEEMEIFNIDDSDDDDTVAQNSSATRQITKTETTPTNKTPLKNVESKNVTDKSMDCVLKSLSKHITIKPTNQPKSHNEEKLQDDENYDTDHQTHSECDNVQQTVKKATESEVQNKLKNLSNITFKGSNSSLKISSSHDLQNIENNKHTDNCDSDSNGSENVKITELPEDYSDDDFPQQKSEPDESNLDKSVTVEEPHDSDNDNVTHSEDYDDIEDQIKSATLKRPMEDSNKTPTFLNSLKNVTIKSTKENKDDDDIPEDMEKLYPVIPNQNKELRIKPYRQASSVSQDENRQAATATKQQVTKSVARVVNQNASTSSNQANVVNKEVTVQRFQTKTVIQEITTTVTKTIRTVNQTVKQEIRNMNQNTSIPVRPQKIQNIRPNQQIRNFQGTPVRTAPPMMGPRIRNAVGPRPLIGANIRPSNQLVPVRGLNVARLSRPRMPVTKNPETQSTTGLHRPVVGKPLKISPNAMLTSTIKRPGAEEASGPFSCFKKPKESLIPGSEIADSNVQYTSSQMSKSNFVSTTKVMKGNSMVTSTQMKSEASSSCEQLTRLSGMSGLKVMKTSQTKQASKVEEKTEISGSKRSTLDAIERLQKQGLLVKKPRLDESNHSEHSNSENDDYYDT
uniref:C2H2-type domain-containing protein n=1 Tax=Pectinophora gossypiella TaxID=13191 RepID=A0A1E1WEM8_PECGO